MSAGLMTLSPHSSKDDRPALFSLTPEALSERLDGPGRARQVFRAAASGFDPFDPGVLPDGLQRRLTEAARPEPMRLERDVTASDGTTKMLFTLRDGRAVESVLIPETEHGPRATLCVSSQVGCARGCRFCVTATMGLVRNLTVAEIVGQVHAGLRSRGSPRVEPPQSGLHGHGRTTRQHRGGAHGCSDPDRRSWLRLRSKAHHPVHRRPARLGGSAAPRMAGPPCVVAARRTTRDPTGAGPEAPSFRSSARRRLRGRLRYRKEAIVRRNDADRWPQRWSGRHGRRRRSVCRLSDRSPIQPDRYESRPLGSIGESSGSGLSTAIARPFFLLLHPAAPRARCAGSLRPACRHSSTRSTGARVRRKKRYVRMIATPVRPTVNPSHRPRTPNPARFARYRPSGSPTNQCAPVLA